MLKIASPIWTDILLTLSIVIIVLLIIALITKYLIKRLYNMFPDDDVMMNEEQYGNFEDDIF